MTMRPAQALLAAALTFVAGTALAGGAAADHGKSSAAAAGVGRTLFLEGTTPSCATCHALRDAQATGAIGPDLDALKPDAARVKKAVTEGFENMPAFGRVLTVQQIDALARYVEQATANRR